jgi:hypothetical protein
MSLRFASKQLADLHHHAQLLIERAGDLVFNGNHRTTNVGVRDLVPSLGGSRLHGAVDA